MEKSLRPSIYPRALSEQKPWTVYKRETHFFVIKKKKKKLTTHTSPKFLHPLCFKNTHRLQTHIHTSIALLTCAVTPPVPVLGPEPLPAVLATLRRPRTRKPRIPPRYRTPQTPCPAAAPPLTPFTRLHRGLRARACACTPADSVWTEHVLLHKNNCGC